MSEGHAPLVHTPRPIVDLADARALVVQLAQATSLSLDTEGDGMFRYRARLCTVQLGVGGEAHVLDTLAFDAAACLRELLGPSGPRKIVHDLSFDARVLHAHGIALGHVFDTSIAARFLGLKSTGLSSLLLQFFGLELPKHKQHADWGARPLDEDALAYLANDVRHLEPLAEVLLERVRAQDIEPEVHEECAYMLAEAQVTPRELAPWMRIKGAALKRPHERARLRELAEVREALGSELDMPPTRIVPNELLVRISELELGELAELEARLGSRAVAHAARFWDALVRARAHADVPEHELSALLPRPPSAAELERKKFRRRLLLDFRTREAAARGVDPQVVLPGHCLSDLVDVERLSVESLLTVPGLGACRVERYGAKLLSDLKARWT